MFFLVEIVLMRLYCFVKSNVSLKEAERNVILIKLCNHMAIV